MQWMTSKALVPARRARRDSCECLVGIGCIAALALAGTTAPCASPEPTHPKAPELCSNGNCAPDAAGNRTQVPAGYELVFADEFSGTELDRSLWCTRYVYGGGAPAQVRDPECQRNGDGTADQLNDELQRYVDYNSRGERLHVVADGVLTLRATKTGTRSGSPYEAAMIRSKYLFKPTADTTYFVTARVKLPNVRGTWPALWLNSDRRPDGTLNWPPEIDIFEGALNEKEDTADMLRLGAAVRSTGQTASGQREITFAAPEFNQRWTTYKAGHSLRDRWIETAIEWTIDEVCYFVDGARIMCERYAWRYNTGEPAAPAHLLANLAIGGSWAGRHGIADEKFPTEFQLDYVRVYEKRRR